MNTDKMTLMEKFTAWVKEQGYDYCIPSELPGSTEHDEKTRRFAREIQVSREFQYRFLGLAASSFLKVFVHLRIPCLAVWFRFELRTIALIFRTHRWWVSRLRQARTSRTPQQKD